MKSIRFQRLIALSAFIVLIASAAAARAQATASDDDKKFVEAALRGGMAEVDLGQLAVKKGASDDVKQFGQKMVDDHTRMGNEMKVVAGKIGVTPPSMTTPSNMALKAKLEVLSGDSFDKAYISAMVKGHEEDLKDFKNEAASGTSPEVKRAASQGATVVSHHLAMIRKIAQVHNVTVSRNGGTVGSGAAANGR